MILMQEYWRYPYDKNNIILWFVYKRQILAFMYGKPFWQAP